MWRWIYLKLVLFGMIATCAAKKSCTIPFDLEANLIVLTATIDGQEGAFILDTGAPTLMLNSTRFEGKASNLEAAGLHAAIKIEEKQVRSFQWNCLNKQNFDAVVLDLSHLEERINEPLLGLIGYDVLKEWHILFDYTQKEIGLYKGNAPDLYDQQKPLAIVPFQMAAHLVLLEINMDEQPYQLIIDSASGSNLLNSDIQSPTLLPIEQPILLRSADQKERIYQQIIAQQTTIATTSFFNQPFIQVDLTKVVEQSDGLLGFPFLSCCKISIDYKKGKIILWEDNTPHLVANNRPYSVDGQ